MSAAKPRTVRAMAREMEPGKVMAYSDAGYYCKDGDYASLIVPDVGCEHDWRKVGNYDRERWCRECGEYQHRSGDKPWRGAKPRILRAARSRA